MNSVDTENNGSHADIATRRRSLKTLLPSTADTESTRWENSFESTRWENFLTVSKIGSKILDSFKLVVVVYPFYICISFISNLFAVQSPHLLRSQLLLHLSWRPRFFVHRSSIKKIFLSSSPLVLWPTVTQDYPQQVSNEVVTPATNLAAMFSTASLESSVKPSQEPSSPAIPKHFKTPSRLESIHPQSIICRFNTFCVQASKQRC